MASKEKKDKVKKQTVKQEPTSQSNGNQKRTIDDGISFHFLAFSSEVWHVVFMESIA